jgi:hypothetical protein
MDSTTKNKSSSKPKHIYTAFAGSRMTKKDKYSWIGLLAAIAILLLAWWARSSH